MRSRLTGKPEGGGVTLLWTGIFLGKEEIAIISALARMSVLPETTPQVPVGKRFRKRK